MIPDYVISYIALFPKCNKKRKNNSFTGGDLVQNRIKEKGKKEGHKVTVMEQKGTVFFIEKQEG